MNHTAISEYVYLFFHQASIQNLQNTGNYIELFDIYSDTIALDMQVQNSGEYEFTYNKTSVSITDVDKFSSFPVDAYLYLFVCKDATFSLDTCNYASIPVKLY
ncbi:MAG: hypothetical protein U9N49_08895 [Campylobacterota bacterium]|nr:hypothetical protein [Campylobacterota bacterium]